MASLSISLGSSVILVLLTALLYAFVGGCERYWAVDVNVVSFTIIANSTKYVASIMWWSHFATSEQFTYGVNLYLLIGGFMYCVGECVFIAISKRISATTKLIVYGYSSFLLVAVSYFLDPSGVAFQYLMMGNAFLIFGQICLTILADGEGVNKSLGNSSYCCSTTDSPLYSRIEDVSLRLNGNVPTDVIPLREDRARTKCDIAEDSDTTDSALIVALAVLSGFIMNSAWSIFILLGELGDEALVDPANILLIINIGHLTGTFLFLCFSDTAVSVSFTTALQSIGSMSMDTIASIILMGLMVWAGDAAYIYGSGGAIPVAVAYAAIQTESAFGLIFGAFFWREFDRQMRQISFYVFLMLALFFYGCGDFILITLA